MRSRLVDAVLLAFLVAALLLALPPVPSSGYTPSSQAVSAKVGLELPLTHENLTATVARSVYINNTLLFMEDNLTIQATGEAELASFLYGVPLRWSEDEGASVVYFSAVNASDGKALATSEELAIGDLDFRGFQVFLPRELEFHGGEELELRIKMVMNGTLLASFRSEIHEFENVLDVPLYPCTSLRLVNATFRAEMPAKSGIPRTEPRDIYVKKEQKGHIWLALHNATDLAEFTSRVLTIKFTTKDPLPIFECPSATRAIVIGPFGSLKITDSYELVNAIDGEVSKLTLLLPKDANSISVSDPMGELETEVEEAGSVKRVKVRLRNPVDYKGHFSLTISYGLPWEDYVEREGINNFCLKLNASDGVNWPVKHMVIKVLLPSGASMRYSSPEPGYLSKGAREEVGFVFDPFMPFGEIELTVAFSYSIFSPSFWPTIWACLAGAVGCVFVKLLRAPPAPVPVPALPTEKLLEFVKTYERRMRLREELASLREALSRKKISRRKYKTRSKAIREELERLDKKVKELSRELIEVGGLVAELLRDLEVAESELASVERDMRALEARYVRKEISSEAYRRLLREYRRREDRARVAMREALLRLREMAGP